MTYVAGLRKTIVVKARRDTVVLLVAVTAVTFGLASAIHSRPNATEAMPVQQQWTGELADLAPESGMVDTDAPITSASLVVPSSDLALPQVPVRALVKLRGCDDEACPPRAMPPPPRRSSLEAANSRRTARRAKPSLMSRLNPLNHLPDVSTLSHPFTVAGDTVSGWFRRF